MKAITILRRVSALGLAVTFLAAPLAAQDMKERQGFVVEGGGGLAVPTGTFANYVDSGPAAQLRVDYWLTPHLALEFGGGASFLEGQVLGVDSKLPDLKLFNYSLGLAANVLPPTERLSIKGNVGLGFSTLDTELFQVGRLPEQDLTKNYFSAEGGVRLGYDVFEDVGLFVEGRALWVRPRTRDLIPLEAFSPDELDPLRNAVLVPVTVGLEVDL